jgi:hypothetical protein
MHRQACRQCVRNKVRDKIVLANHHVRTLLFGAARVNDGGRLASSDRITNFWPSEVLDPDRLGVRDWPDTAQENYEPDSEH